PPRKLFSLSRKPGRGGGRGNRSGPQSGAPSAPPSRPSPPWQQQQYPACQTWGWTSPPWGMPLYPYPTSQWTRLIGPPKQPGILGQRP
ncbi:hypothetical protein A2U01_0042864, partial [Trifolium medium]|nr:hypothetical protein [Trifolium medium]